jgi:pyruvate formate lyase activating enzyme
MACASCREACPQQGITLGEKRLSIDRVRCLGCFACSRACPTGAVEAKGREISVKELARELLKDRAYFGAEGGVTLSGGEALMQAETIELLRELHAADVSVAVDTCGQIKPERLDAALAYADLVLYDLKLVDSAEHERWTGVGNELIVANLARVVQWATARKIRSDNHRSGRSMTAPKANFLENANHSQTTHPNRHLWLRTPVIPGATDSDANIIGLARLVATLPHPEKAIERWEFTAFNNLCTAKYESIERIWSFADAPLMTAERMEQLVALAKTECPGIDIRATGATATMMEE